MKDSQQTKSQLIAELRHLQGRVTELEAVVSQCHQVKTALGESEKQYRTLLENIPIGVYRNTPGPQGRFLMVNRAFLHIFGFQSEADLNQITVADLYLNPRDRTIFSDKLLAQGSVTGLELHLKKRDGTPLWGSITARVVYDETGEAVYFDGTVEDITARKQVQAELHHRNRELTLLNRIIALSTERLEVEAILETVCRELALAFDLPQAAAALLNETKTEAVVVAEYLAEGRPSGLNEHIPIKGNPSFEHLLRQKTPLLVKDAQHDPRLAPVHDLLRRRGTVSLLVLPLLVAGEVIGSLGLDAITPRRFSAEEVSLAWSVADQVAGVLARVQLNETSELLGTAIEQSAENIIITNASGTILYVNSALAQTSGYSRTELRGQSLRVLESNHQDPGQHQKMWAAIRAGQVWRGRIVNQKKDGSHYTVEASISPVRDANGLITHYVSAQRDVTRELQLEEQYLQAQKMEAVGQLTAGIAHDFNNLIMGMTGAAELMQTQMHSEDPLWGMTETILRSGSQAANLVRQLLIFSRKQMVKPQIVDLNAGVTNMNQLLKRIIGEHIQITLQPASALWPVKVDPGQMEQVIVNLAVNARDAMPAGGKLMIATENIVVDEVDATPHFQVQPGEYVRLTVSDTGIGMSQEVQTRIFEPFFTTKEPGKGTGLGLATVYGIIRQSDGYIEVDSQVGRGTTFKVYLPRAEAEMMPATPRPEARTAMPAGQETILVVEDDATIRKLIHDVLHRQGYTLLRAQNGQEALGLSSRHTGPLHLLLTDVILPGMSGKELAAQLSQSHPDLKVIFMSGYTDDIISSSGELSQNVNFLQKPFSFMDMTRKVRDVLDS